MEFLSESCQLIGAQFSLVLFQEPFSVFDNTGKWGGVILNVVL